MDADVVIIGAGPAGVQAAIHAARKKAATVLVGKTGNSAMHGTELENYFGFQQVQSGTDILMHGIEQAKSFGCTVLDMNVMSLSREGDLFTAALEDGTTVSARALIVATGTSRIKLGVPGEREFANGKGVSYCAVCDCNFYRQKTVALVGGQAEAVADAEMLNKQVLTLDPKAICLS